jgi:hypothetical protein
MVLWGWLITLLKGFVPIDGKRIGKLIWVISICFGCLFVWNKLNEPKTKIEKIETQVINQCPEESKILGLGLNIWKLKIRVGI